jgi:hypothetical protein
MPMITMIAQQSGATPDQLLVDAGYCSDINFAAIADTWPSPMPSLCYTSRLGHVVDGVTDDLRCASDNRRCRRRGWSSGYSASRGFNFTIASHALITSH